MKLAIARIYHETNTFNPHPTTLDALRSYGYYEGFEMLDPAVASSETAGAVDSAGRLGVELIGLLKVGGWAGGRLKQEDFEYIKKRLLEKLDESLPVDGVYLALHGALSSEEEDDAEGDMLEAVREHVGPDTPLALTCDMHANITERMIRNADFLAGYHTCPHLDTEEMGRLGVQVLYDILSGRCRPAIYWCKLPMIVPADLHNTSVGPLQSIFAKVAAAEADPDVLSASVFAVQPWLDVPELGWTVVVAARERTDRGTEYCTELARECWQRRKEFDVAKLTPAEAIREARLTRRGPVVIADGADATNAGALGNSTRLLSEILDQGADGLILIPLLDPKMAREAHSAGKGGAVRGKVGAEPHNPFSPPVHISASVLALSNGKFSIAGHGGRNLTVDMGKTAALVVGDVVLVVSERPGPAHDPLLFRHLGLEPEDAKIVIVKSPVGFRAAYEPIAEKILLADAPGAATSNLRSLDYSKRPRPLYPFEDVGEPEVEVRVRA